MGEKLKPEEWSEIDKAYQKQLEKVMATMTFQQAALSLRSVAKVIAEVSVRADSLDKGAALSAELAVKLIAAWLEQQGEKQ